VTEIAARHRADVRATSHGEAFITLPGAQSALMAAAVEAETGAQPELSTTGGTVRRPLPARALPGDRVRPHQRDDAQDRRGGGGAKTSRFSPASTAALRRRRWLEAARRIVALFGSRRRCWLTLLSALP
jgi:hypothetical protein